MQDLTSSRFDLITNNVSMYGKFFFYLTATK